MKASLTALMGSILVIGLPLAAHGQGWLLLCPYAQPTIERSHLQVRAFDSAAECEATRASYEKRCAQDARHKALAIKCDCECWPARTCN